MEQQKIIARLKRWMTRNRTALAQAGVATIMGTYCGSGDEGNFEGVETMNAQGIRINYDLPETIFSLVEALAEELAPPRYEDGDGGGGEIRLDVGAGTITHESYYYEVKRSSQGLETY